MSRTIDVVVHCANSPNRFKVVFEEKQPEEWYVIRIEKISSPSFFERKAKGDTGQNDKSLFAKLKGVFYSPQESKNVSVKGTFYSNDFECPYCGNKDYVKCGNCQEWTCKNADSTHFKCAACENSGEVSGYIDSALGDLSQSNNSMSLAKDGK